jgi:GAF domain-containing protein
VNRDDPQALETPARLAALAETLLMDSPAEPSFDRATRLAQRLLGVSVSLVSLVDERRQFFKSAVGLPEPWSSRRGTPLSHSFCQHVIRRDEPLVVDDATTDERVRGNGAIEDLGVVAYLGVPVRGPDGDVLGTLCAIEHEPRRWTAEDLAVLTDVAAGVTAEIALRVQSTRLDAFARSAAHELRTPLTSLGIRLEDVAGWPDLDDPVRGELLASLGQVRRLADRLDDHLELVRTGRVGGGEQGTLDELLREFAGRWDVAAAGRGCDLRVELGGDASVRVPLAGVRQVLDLLVEDALDRGARSVVVRPLETGGATRVEVRLGGASEAEQPVGEAEVRGSGAPRPSRPPRELAGDLARTFGGRLLAPQGATSTQLLLPARP